MKSLTQVLLAGILAFFAIHNSSAQTYATLPFTENFENAWVNKNGTRDVPSVYWKNTPATGNNSWSRDDDGIARGAWSTGNNYAYSPAGANNSLHSATFNSYMASSDGTLELYINFSTLTGSKALYFYYLNTDGNDKLEVSISTDGGTTFGTPVATVGIRTSWTKYCLDLGNLTSSTGVIRFKGKNSCCNSRLGIDEIYVGSHSTDPVVANFSASRLSGMAPLAVSFNNLTTGDATTWAWDFNNDGITDATVRDPLYTFKTSGIYTVKLSASKPGSAVATKTITITVDPTVYASLPFYESFDNAWIDRDSIKDVPALYFQNSPPSLVKRYDAVGYDSYLPRGARNTLNSARIHSFNSKTSTLDIYVDFSTQSGNKTLSFWYINISGSDKLEVFLSTDGGATFGSAIVTKTIQSNWEKISYDLGNITASKGVIRFKATPGSDLDMGLDEVQISNPAAVNVDAYFVSDKISGPAPLTVNFTDQSGGAPTTWNWDFNNDGTLDASTQNSSYTYTSPGVYSVKMTASKTGSSDTQLRTNGVLVTGKASLPFSESFENTWASRDDNRDVPGPFWKGSPATGNNSWSAIGDGMLRGAWFSNYGDYPFKGANGTSSSATFYSTLAVNVPGMLDLSIDFSSQTGNKRLSFWYINKGGSDKLDVMISTDGGATFGSSVVSLGVVPFWTKIVVDLGNVSSSNGIVRFKGSAAYDNTYTNIGLDEVNVWTPEQKPLKADFKVSAGCGPSPLATTFTDLSDGAPTSWAWDFNNDGITDATTQNPGYTFNKPGCYTVVLTVGKNGTTVTEKKVNFIVVTGYAALPFRENFENTWVCRDGIRDVPSAYVKNSPAMGGTSWSRDDDGVARQSWTSDSYGYSPTGADGTFHSARLQHFGGTSNLDFYIDFSTIQGNKYLSFWFLNSQNDKIDVYLSTDGGATFGSSLKTLVYVNNWTKYQINLGNVTSSTGIIRFTAQTGAYYGQDMGLDEVGVNDVDAAFSSNISSGASPLKVTFTDQSTGNPTSWKWDFTNDGTTDATTQNPTYTFTGVGTYSVKLVASNGLKDSIVKTSYIKIKPIAYAILPYEQGFEGAWQNLDNTRDVPSLNWQNTPATGNNSWSRDDDGIPRGAWTQNYYPYSPAGSNGSGHSARFHSGNTILTGCLDMYVNFSSVSGYKALYFSYINTSGNDNMEVLVSDDGGVTFGNALTWLNTRSNWSRVAIDLSNHTSQYGVIRFKATGDNGSDIGIDSIYVGPPSTTPVKAAFSTSKVSGFAPHTVKFNNQSTGDATSWEWDLDGDGVTDSNDQNPEYTFQNTGMYSVRLIAHKNDKSDTLVCSSCISVMPPQYASVPYFESFDNVWANKEDIRDVPSLSMRNIPATGNNSWTRSDDFKRTWTGMNASNLEGALGTPYYSRFNTNGTNGVLDVYVDFSTQLGTKQLSFFYNNASGTDKLEVFLSKDGGATFNSVIPQLTTTTGWTKVSADLGFVYGKGLVRFKATGDMGLTDIGIDEITICNPSETSLHTDFSADKFFGSAPLTINITDESLGSPTSWAWNFNNDNTPDAVTQNASYTYTSPGSYLVKLKASNSESSDSVSKIIQVTGYAKLPFYENFDQVWISRDHVRDVPSPYFKCTPNVGNGAWSREDDGISRGAWNYTYGGYTPAGFSSGHSASFNSSYTSLTGMIDMYIDFSSMSGNKTCSFYYINKNGSDSISIYLSTDGGVTDGTLIGSKKNASVWTKLTFDLGNVTTSTGVIRIKAKGDYGSSNIGVDEIRVESTGASVPEAKFTANITSGKAPLKVQFTDQSTGEFISRSWDFNSDGQTDSYLNNPSCTYTKPGLYSVSLSVNGDGTMTKVTKNAYIQVVDSVSGDFEANITQGFAPLLVSFMDHSKGTATSWKWDFNSDGKIDAICQQSTYLFTKPGRYDVKLIVSNGLQNDTVVKTGFIVVKSKATVPYQESFDDVWVSRGATRDVPSFSWTNSPAGANYAWSREDDGVTRKVWNSNDGSYSPAGANGSPHSARFHSYEFMENYFSSYSLDVDFSTMEGCKTLSFYYINPNGKDSLKVYLSADGGKTFGNPILKLGTSEGWTKVSVDLGTLRSTNGVILFSPKGNLDNSDLGIDELTIEASGTVPVKSAFASNVKAGLAPLKVKFTDESSGNPTIWNWDFDNDGVIDSTAQNPSFIFNKVGSYSVRLISSNRGSKDSELKTSYIHVVPPIDANFTSNAIKGAAPLKVTFTDKSTGGPTSWRWDFNDDGVIDDTTQNPVYVFNTAGTYKVKMIALNIGTKDSIIKESFIKAEPLQFAKMPYSQDFESNWVDLDGTRDVPSLNWLNQFEKGNNSWSREDDGLARGAWTSNYGLYYPNAANGLHSARFHNTDTYLSGSLDLYVDFSSYIGYKALYFHYFNCIQYTNLEVLVSTDGVTFADTIAVLGIQNSWTKVCLDLTKYSLPKGIIRFKVKGSSMGYDLGIDNVYVGPVSTTPVTAAFTPKKISGYVPVKIGFTDNSTGEVTSWNWDLNGDGIIESTKMNPEFTYEKPGTYNVKLIAYKADKKDSITKVVFIQPQPYASLPFIESFEKNWINRDDLRDVPSNYMKNNPAWGNNSWSRNDFSDRWDHYYNYSYTPGGALGTTYSARYNSLGASGLSGALDVYVDFTTQFGIHQLSFWYINSSGSDKLNVLLSKDGGATFADTLAKLTTQPLWAKVSIDLGFLYIPNGVLRFKATGDGGASDLGIDQIFIGAPASTPPKADIVADKTSGTVPLTVNYTDESIGSVSSWEWDFNNDGVTDATTKNPSYTYTSPGSYSVKLKVTGALGSDSIIKTNQIVVTGYAKLPFSENFERNWVSRDGLRDVPSQYFRCTPAVSENAWSSDNDAVARHLWFLNWGGYTPSGVSSNHSARFHSGFTSGTGTMDLFVDFSTMNGNKTLSFWYINISGSDSIKIYLSTDGGITDGTFLGSKKVSSQWTKFSFDLGNIATETGVLRFKAVGDGTNSDIGIDDINIGLTGAAALDAKFSSDKTVGVIPFTVQFKDESTGNIKNRIWDFNGDGRPDSNSQNPSFIYNKPGIYTVSLSVSGDSTVDTETKQTFITVVDHVESQFTSDVTEGFAPLFVNFKDQSSGEPTSWDWDFTNHGFTDSYVQNPSNAFSKPGNYTVTLRIANAMTKDTLIKTGYIKVKGKAVLPYKENFDDPWYNYGGVRDVPSYNWINAPASANYSWSRDDDGVLRKAWISNEGVYTPAGANGSPHSARFHSYNFMNGYLNSFYLNVDFSTLKGEKTLSFYYINPGGSDGLKVYLSSDNGKTFGSPVTSLTTSSTWTKVSVDLGNVTSPDGIILFTPSADLDNTDLGIDELSIQSTEVIPVITDFSADTIVGTPPFTVKFTDKSTGSPTSWKWDFNNDGITDSISQNPSYIFKSVGTYSVKLISAKSGSMDYKEKFGYITVVNPIIANFEANKTYGFTPLIVSFKDKSSGLPTKWEWDFNNDGITDATDQNPVFTFTPGLYTVKLTASNSGIRDVEIKTGYINVIEPVDAQFTADVTTGAAPLTVKFTDQSTGNPTSWNWDFNNDGITDIIDQNPVWVFSTPGTYSVSLKASKTGSTNTEFKQRYIEVKNATGIDQIRSDGEIMLYPNPSEGILNVKSEHLFQNVSKMEVVDLYGKTVKVFMVEEKLVTTIDLNDQPSGTYNLKVYFKDHVSVYKFILRK